MLDVSLENAGGLKRRLHFRVPGGEVDRRLDEGLREKARTARLNGFRPGKVPLKVIRSRFGGAVREEVVGRLIGECYAEAVDRERLSPVGTPRFERADGRGDGDFRFTASFEVLPQVTVPDFSGIRAERLAAELTEADIDGMVETLRRQRRTGKAVERPAAAGDRLNIDFTGSRDGTELEKCKGKGFALELGSGAMIPGFEDGLVGRRAGEAVPLRLTFPDDYRDAELSGATVDFTVTVNAVEELSLPAVDEAFFREFGVKEGGERAFREEVARNMRREMAKTGRAKLRSQILRALAEKADFELPQALLADAVLRVKAKILEGLGVRKATPEQVRGVPDAWAAALARRHAVFALLQSEIVRRESMRADPDRVRAAIEEEASTYESPEEVVKWYYRNERMLEKVRSGVLEEQVIEHIIERAEVVERSVAYAELIAPETGVPAAAPDPAAPDAAGAAGGD